MLALPSGLITSEEPWTNHLPAKLPAPAPAWVRWDGGVVTAAEVAGRPLGEPPPPPTDDVPAQPAAATTVVAATVASAARVRARPRTVSDTIASLLSRRRGGTAPRTSLQHRMSPAARSTPRSGGAWPSRCG